MHSIIYRAKSLQENSGWKDVFILENGAVLKKLTYNVLKEQPGIIPFIVRYSNRPKGSKYRYDAYEIPYKMCYHEGIDAYTGKLDRIVRGFGNKKFTCYFSIDEANSLEADVFKFNTLYV